MGAKVRWSLEMQQEIDGVPRWRRLFPLSGFFPFYDLRVTGPALFRVSYEEAPGVIKGYNVQVAAGLIRLWPGDQGQIVEYLNETEETTWRATRTPGALIPQRLGEFTRVAARRKIREPVTGPRGSRRAPNTE